MILYSYSERKILNGGLFIALLFLIVTDYLYGVGTYNIVILYKYKYVNMMT